MMDIRNDLVNELINVRGDILCYVIVGLKPEEVRLNLREKRS